MSDKRLKQNKKEGKSYHHGNLREVLKAEALLVIAESGMANVSLRELARRAGVSTAAPYRHYESREALLAIIAEEGFRLLNKFLTEAVERFPDDPILRFRETGIAYVCFAYENQAYFHVMFSSMFVDKSSYPTLYQESRQAFGRIVDSVTACREAGLLRDMDPRKAQFAAWSMVHGLASLAGSGQHKILGMADTPIEEMAASVADVLAYGLGKPNSES